MILMHLYAIFMQAFLILLLDKLQRDMLKEKDRMNLMITCFTGDVPIEPQHVLFWKNVLNLTYGKLRYSSVCLHVDMQVCIIKQDLHYL